VIEVDGVQHYLESGRPSTTLYAEMVEADRQLKLCGYEVYRFGGGELQGERGKDAVRSFFGRLFEKYDIK
jgi:very-short-patch-repair endonuclease